MWPVSEGRDKPRKNYTDQPIASRLTPVFFGRFLFPRPRGGISQETAEIDEKMRREKNWFYPWEAVRETVINALAHRDWTRSVDVEVTNYSNRLEVISPGKLQNSMTISKMVAGQRSPRNTLIMEILRDYGYVDSRGMGVRTKVIPLMKKFNCAEPFFEATEDYLKVELPRKKSDE